MALSRGVLFMAASALSFSVMSLLVKLASARLPMGEIVLARALVTLAASVAMVWRARLPPPGPWGTHRGKLVLRGALGFCGLGTYYGSLALLPLPEATTLQNLVPLVSTWLGWWILGERVGRSALLALALGIAGVLLIVQPGGSGAGLAPAGVALGLASAACSAVAYATVRQLARTEHPLVIVLYFPLVATPLAIPWAAAAWVTPTATEVLLLVGLGLATQAGQVFLTLGLAAERLGPATAASYLQIVFAIGWQLALFGVAPPIATLAGAALIVAGTAAVARGAPRAEAARPPGPAGPDQRVGG